MQHVLAFIVGLAVTYGFGSFLAMDMDINNWGYDGRFFMLLVSITWPAVSLLLSAKP